MGAASSQVLWSWVQSADARAAALDSFCMAGSGDGYSSATAAALLQVPVAGSIGSSGVSQAAAAALDGGDRIASVGAMAVSRRLFDCLEMGAASWMPSSMLCLGTALLQLQSALTSQVQGQGRWTGVGAPTRRSDNGNGAAVEEEEEDDDVSDIGNLRALLRGDPGNNNGLGRESEAASLAHMHGMAAAVVASLLLTGRALKTSASLSMAGGSDGDRGAGLARDELGQGTD